MEMITKQEREDLQRKRIAIEHLKDPMLLKRLVLDGLDENIVGEDQARKIIFLCGVGSYVLNSNKTSYNLMVNSESGAGKDHLVNNVLQLFSKKIMLKRTRISPKALTYWHNSKFEPKWTWDGKILYLEDCSDEILNCDVFKVFVSGGSHATIVKDQMAIDIEIKGKPVVVITSAEANPKTEMLRRFVVVNLTETEEQTKEVMGKWADHSINGDLPPIHNDYSWALDYLLPRKVKIPWARNLIKFFPSKHIIMRTHFSRFLDFVKASAVLHQYGREIDVEGYLIATKQDYEIAKEIILSTSCNDQMVPLTKNQKELLSVIKAMGTKIEGEGLEEQERGWTHSELCSSITMFGRSQLYRELTNLVKMGFVKKGGHRFSYENKTCVTYSYRVQGKVLLPPWGSISDGK